MMPGTPNLAPATRLRVLEALTVLVPAVCAGIYETARHSFLANEFSNGVGTAVAVAIVLALSFAFARASFGIIHRMEARLVERNRRLHALSQDARRLATLEERERLAREIHDGVAQVIATLLVRVDTIEGLVARGRTAEAGAELRDLRASGGLANVEVREAIAGLRANPLPGAAGLADALRRYVDEFGARTGIDATFQLTIPTSPRYPQRSASVGGRTRAPGERRIFGAGANDSQASPGESADPELPPGHELHLMRVATEALTNVRKHAAARTVSVTLTAPATPTAPVARPAWSLEIVDDGVGFDLETTAPPARSEIATKGAVGTDTGSARRRHFGLAMMRERVTALGGTCTVTSSVGSGTRVHVLVPSSDPEHDWSAGIGPPEPRGHPAHHLSSDDDAPTSAELP